MFGNNNAVGTSGKVQQLVPGQELSVADHGQGDEQRPAEMPVSSEQPSVIKLSRPIKVGRDGAFREYSSVTVKPVLFTLFMEIGEIDRAIVTSINDQNEPTGFDVQTDRKALLDYMTRLTGLTPPEFDLMAPSDVREIAVEVRQRVSVFSGNSKSGTEQTS